MISFEDIHYRYAEREAIQHFDQHQTLYDSRKEAKRDVLEKLQDRGYTRKQAEMMMLRALSQYRGK
jgi:predicted Ser/Thr protein kinase